MKTKIAVFCTLICLLLAGCGIGSQDSAIQNETTEPVSVPVIESTTPVLEATIPEETTAHVSDDTIPEGYSFSFFLYNISRYLAYCDYYIAPAGTEDWHPVFIDKDTIDWEHPRIPGAHKNDDVAVMRAFVAYDGPENTQWVLRIEFPNEDVGTDFPNIPQPYSYQWDTAFELQNNQTLLHLGFVPDYMTLGDDVEMGAWYTPIAEPMEFCESCPEHWRIPIE